MSRPRSAPPKQRKESGSGGGRASSGPRASSRSRARFRRSQRHLGAVEETAPEEEEEPLVLPPSLQLPVLPFLLVGASSVQDQPRRTRLARPGSRRCLRCRAPSFAAPPLPSRRGGRADRPLRLLQLLLTPSSSGFFRRLEPTFPEKWLRRQTRPQGPCCVAQDVGFMEILGQMACVQFATKNIFKGSRIVAE